MSITFYRYYIRSAVLLTVLLLGTTAVFCQTFQPVTEVDYVADNKKIKIPVTVQIDRSDVGWEMTPESHRALLEWFYGRGYFSATVDSHKVLEEKATVFMNKGCRYAISDLHIEDTVPDSLDIAPVDPLEAANRQFTNKQIEQEIRTVLDYYQRQGFALAEVQISSFEPQPDSCNVAVNLMVDAGERMRVRGLLFPDLKVNSPDYIRTVSGVEDSALITPELLQTSKRNLENTNLFKNVAAPDIVIRDEGYFLQYALQESNPNSFDGLLGLVPDEGGGNTVVGDVKLRIRNIIWDGSTTDINFRRLQDEVTRLNLGFKRDWILDVPLGAGLNFNFLQQDSSYQVRNLILKGSYTLGGTTNIVGSLRRQTSVANDDPNLNVDVLDAQATFAGLGLEFNSTDSRISPTSGLEISLNLETGFKNISDERAEADSIDSRLRQRVFEFRLQPYFPVFSRTVLTSSLNAFVIQSDQLTESDLFRFGGARSLRGFREDQFFASRVFWGDLEYRYRLDPQSYAFVFGAISNFERPGLSTESRQVADQIEWVNSWGFGMTFSTPLGLLQLSYAVSSEDTFRNGKVHFGIIADI